MTALFTALLESETKESLAEMVCVLRKRNLTLETRNKELEQHEKDLSDSAGRERARLVANPTREGVSRHGS